MKSRVTKLCLVLFTMLFISVSAFAQKTVTGTVVDNYGEPIIGANVVVKGSQEGTMTDADGNFSLKNVSDNATLKVSFMGYATQEVSVAGKSKINVTLEEDNQMLDEVVMVGYGVQRKIDVTGATAHVGAQQLTAMPVKDAFQGMQGKVAGVDITNSQRPGEVGNIQIRGVRSPNAGNEPLYVVDGVMLQNGGIENINPQDIETIDVLKDAASTAIYGSRGANGVVIVTTKHGKQGKVSVNYAGSVTWSWLYDVADMMTASEWLDYARMAKYNSVDKNGKRSYNSTLDSNGKVVPVYAQDKNLWGSVPASWANIEKAWAGGSYDASKVGSYDWADEGKQTGVSHEHTISFAGGSEKFQGSGSFGYLNSEGVIPGQEYERYTMKTNFDVQALPYLKLGSSILGAYGVQDYGYSFTKSTTGAGDYYGALQAMLPWTVPYDENGNYLRNPNGDVNIINPIEELKYNTNRRSTFNVNSNFFAELDFGKIWAPLEGLTFRSQLGAEFKFYELGQFNAKDGINGDGNNKASLAKQQYRSWVLDNILNYKKTFGDHSVGLTLVQSANKYFYDYQNNSSSNVAMTTELWYNLGSSTSYSLGTDHVEHSMASYIARLNYSFQDKYLLQASVRRDGASQLADGHKWDAFPSVSLGWRLEQEDFMQSTEDWLDALKIRASYGVSGNAAIAEYSTKGAIQSLNQQWGSTVVLGYVGSDASAKTPNMAANLTLGWEHTSQLNFGVDFSFINSRVSGSVDFYTTKTTDCLMIKSIPSINGYTSTYDNVGKTRGHGVDIQLNGTPIKNKDFAWTVGLSWSADRCYIDELANGKSEDLANKWIVDELLGIEYDYVYDGIWKTGQTVTLADGTTADASTYGRKTGQIKVKDLNGDGKIDGTNDRAIVGKVRPDWSAGLTNTFTYKQWELSAFIYARMGFDVRAGALTLDGRYMQRSINYFVEGHNENADYYAPGINGESADTYQSSQNYQDGSYIKVRNINLGYNFKPSQLKKTGLSSVKIYAQCMNPFSIYRATDWLDTDFVNYSNNTKAMGATSATRSFVMGVNIGF
jgi:TonB-linked SusC/RagA family outer membrane protein